MVKRFIDLLVDDKVDTKFPYSTEEYRGYIKHSLWLLPNRTKVIEAMERLLRNHPVFGRFGIVNISGNARGDDEADTDAKSRVKTAIKNNEYTITLTGQRLTTGASIPEWTAVMMMSDTASATTYLQTAFRCQTPAHIVGKLKTQGYVFDFAPDRTLRLVAEAIELNHKSGKVNTPEQRDAMVKFLNFCPILAARSGRMEVYDVGSMLVQLKKAIVERVSRNGFDDPKLYNDELLQLDELEIGKFNELRELVGKSNTERTNEIKVNDLGMDKLEAQKAEGAERKKKKKQELTEEEKEALRKLQEARKQKQTAISILRAVSIRMPMLVYGADVSIREDITLDKFIDIVDDESWLEFMPAGLTKEMFRDFTKYYDQEVFRGVARSIRAKAFDYDLLPPVERIQALAEVFATFKNPDKETVLTPWSVVNMQLSTTLGGGGS
jgi:type I site-specific restriction endonuclease